MTKPPDLSFGIASTTQTSIASAAVTSQPNKTTRATNDTKDLGETETSATGASTAAETPSPENRSTAPRPLRESAFEAISHFLEGINGQPYTELYDMVIAQVEEPLLAAVMEYTKGNQSKASELLGLNRGTLRKKLRQYKLIEKSEPAPNPRLLRRQARPNFTANKAERS